MRVLHVLHPWHEVPPHLVRPPGGSDAATLLCMSVIDATPENEHHVALIGGSESGRRDLVRELPIAIRIAPALKSLAFARRPLQRWIRSVSDFDSILAWDVDPAKLGIDPDRACWMGLSGDARTSEPVPTPPFNTPSDRDELRASLGLRESDFVLALIADPPSRGDATRLIFLVSMLQIIGLPVVAMLHAASYGLRRATSAVRLAYSTRPPILHSRPLSAYLSACDAAVLALGSRFGGHALPATRAESVLASLALRHGVPVMTSDPDVLPPALAPVCRTSSGHPGDLSRALLPLAEDRAELNRVRALCKASVEASAATFSSYARSLIRPRAASGVSG